jgi:hypothetical protein
MEGVMYMAWITYADGTEQQWTGLRKTTSAMALSLDPPQLVEQFQRREGLGMEARLCRGC